MMGATSIQHPPLLPHQTDSTLTPRVCEAPLTMTDYENVPKKLEVSNQAFVYILLQLLVNYFKTLHSNALQYLQNSMSVLSTELIGIIDEDG